VKRGGARGTREAGAPAPLLTPDLRYIVVRGRLWRATNPAIGQRRRQALTNELMEARRAVAVARRAGDARELAAARRLVQAAKEALGERGPPWWKDGARDYNRFLVKNTPYKGWFERNGRN
jgi:hypothetical protein